MEKKNKYKWLFLAVVTVLGFGIDIGTKQWAAGALTPGRPVNVIGEYLQFALVYNDAAIFGLDPRSVLSWFPLNRFLFVFNIIAVAIILVYYHTTTERDRLVRVGLALILAGAFGNLFDRVIHAGQGVVDFIKMGLSRELYWPIYNIADVYITFGVGCIIVNLVREEIQRMRSARKSAETENIHHDGDTVPR